MEIYIYIYLIFFCNSGIFMGFLENSYGNFYRYLKSKTSFLIVSFFFFFSSVNIQFLVDL